MRDGVANESVSESERVGEGVRGDGTSVAESTDTGKGEWGYECR